ncbi:MAG: cyclic nucleotide-binding domain-containing protein [Neptuniibacter sp.]
MSEADDMSTKCNKVVRTVESDQPTDLLFNHVGFGCLSKSDIDKLAQSSPTISLRDGDKLFEKGDISSCFYVLKSGSATSHSPSTINEVTSIYQTGDLVGFMGVLTDRPRVKAVFIDSDAELIKIDKDKLDQIFSGRQELKGVLIAEYDIHGFKGAAAKKSTFSDDIPPEIYKHPPLLKLKEKITSSLSNSLFGKTISKVEKLYAHNDLLISMMAGCALVSSDKAGVGVSEYQYINSILGRLSSLGNISKDDALAKFNHYCSAIISDPVKGKQEALIALSHVSKGSENAKIVLSVCHAMIVLHIESKENASQILQEISERLGVFIEEI